jgi:hypothetical protein
VYVNDEIRLAPNFTLSVGLRHDAELNTMNNDYTVPWASDPVLQAIPELRGYLNAGNRKNALGNISPRVSFSWDPFKDNRTFVRGGFGIIYDRVTSFMGFQERRNSTWRTYSFANPGTRDPAVLRQRVIAGASANVAPILMNNGMQTPRSRQMSVGVGHQLTPSFGFNVDYVRQHMDHLYVQRNPNYLDRSVTPARRKLTPSYGDILIWDDIGESDYSSVLVQATWQRGVVPGRLRPRGAADVRVPVPVQPAAHHGGRAAPAGGVQDHPAAAGVHLLGGDHHRQPAPLQLDRRA